MSFPAAIAAAMPPDDNLRIGVVILTSPLTVSVQGAPVVMGRLSSYTPTLSDSVAVFRQDSTWLCLGKVVAP